MNNNRSQNVTNYTKLINTTCVDAALKAPMQTPQNKALERGRMTSVRCSVKWTMVIQLNSM